MASHTLTIALSNKDYKNTITKTVNDYVKQNKHIALDTRHLVERSVFAETQLDLDVVNELSKHSESWLLNGN